MEVAALGLRVDADGVDGAAKSLSNMAAQGERAETSLKGVEQTASKTQKALEKLGQAGAGAEQAVKKVGDGVGAIGDGGQAAAQKVDNASKSIVGSINKTAAAATAAEKSAASFYEVIGRPVGASGGGGVMAYVDQLKKAEAAQGAAAQGLEKIGMSAKATEAALRGVPAQFTDIVVSLQGGMNPMTVFLQQGGQLKDMFGGAGAAAKALGGYVLGLVNPFTVAAAAAATLAVAYNQGSQEADNFVRAITLSGNASGVTANQLREQARQISALTSTQGRAASGLADFVAAGVRGGDELRRYTQTALEWEKATGQAVDKTAAQFASLQKDPLAAVLKLNEGANFLTVSVYEQIKALEEQGHKAQASKVAMDALDGAMRERGKTIKDSLGYIESGWAAITRVASKAWDAMLNVGRQSTVSEQLEDIRRQLLIEQRRLEGAERASFGGSRETKAQELRIRATVEALKAQEIQLAATMQAEEKAAAAKAEGNRLMQARAEFDKKYQKALEGEITLNQKLDAARREAVAAGKNEADIKTVLAWVTEEHNKANKGSAAAARLAKKELSDQAKVYAELAGLSSTYYDELARGQKELAKGNISREQYIKYVEELIKKQPFAIALEKEAEKAHRELQKAWADDEKAFEKLGAQRESSLKTLQDHVRKMQDEEEAQRLSTEGSISLAEATERLTIARLQDHLAMARAGAESQSTIDALERELAARQKLLGAIQTKDVREANKKAADEAAKDWEKVSQTISRTLSDYIMAGGKNAAQYMKRLFATLVLEPMVQTAVGSVLGIGKAAAGNAASGTSPFELSTALLFKDFGGGVANSLNLLGGKAYNAGLESFGESLMDFSSTLKGYSGVINTAGSVLSYGKALLDIADGKYGSGIGTAVGQYFGGPIGATIGNFLGGALDKALGSRGANHSGAAASSLGVGNTAAAQKLMGDSRGDWYTDLTTRYNAGLETQLSGTVGALASVYEKLSGYAGDAARSIELVGGFAVNGKYGDEGAVGYGQLWDRVSGQYLGGFSNRDLGTDQQAAWTSFVGEMGGLIVDQLKASDIPGWMRKELDAIGDDVTVEGLNAALHAIATVDAAFKGWANTLTGFADLSAEVQTSLIKTSGTIEGLGTNVNAFYAGFYSESERMGILQRQVLEQLSSLDVTVDTSTAEAAKESFRATVEGALNAGNGELAAKLLALSGSFATAADYAAQSAEAISNAAKETAETAKEAAAAVAELAANLRTSLIGLESQFAGGGFARQYQAGDLAGQVQGLFAGVGIEKDAGVLAGQILSATSGEIEEYFRSMWGMLDTDEARQKLVTVTGALLDLAGSAETAANAVKQERAGLEQRWLQATGNTAELRRRELEALDPSNRALLLMIYGLEDAKTSMTDLTNAAQTAAQKAAAAWQNWGTAAGLGATYLGDTSGLEARRAILGAQIAGSSDPADRLSKLQELISVEQAIGQAQQASRKTELEAINARQSALQKEVASAQQLLSAAQGLGSYVQSLRLGEASGLSEADRLGALGSEYTSLVGKARGGDADALQRLQSVAGDYLGLSRSMSASGSDYALLAGRVSSELEAVAKAQELVAQSGITAREAEMAQLTQQTEFLSAGVELSDEVKRLIQKSMLEQQDVWGRESMRAETLQELQQRAVDSLALMPAGIASAIKPTIESSATYIANSVGGSVSSAINALAGMLGAESVPAFAAGGLHMGGLRLVGERGPELEVTGPARYWSAGQTQALLGGGGNTARLEALVERLVEDNRRQAGEIVRLNLRVARVLEQWEGDGMPPQRKEGAIA